MKRSVIWALALATAPLAPQVNADPADGDASGAAEDSYVYDPAGLFATMADVTEDVGECISGTLGESFCAPLMRSAGIATVIGTITRSFYCVNTTVVCGPFQSLNEILKGLTIQLPTIKTKASGVEIVIKNLRCTGFQIHDATLDWEQKDITTIAVKVAISGVELKCNLEWEGRALGLRPQGVAVAAIEPPEAGYGKEGGSLSVHADFTSTNFSQRPPTSAEATACHADFPITRFELSGKGFTGGIVSGVINIKSVRTSVKNKVQEALASLACDEVSALFSGLLTKQLKRAYGLLEPFLVNVSASGTEEMQLKAEREMMQNRQPKDLQIMNLAEHPILKYARYAADRMLEAVNEYDELAVNRLITDKLGADGVFDVLHMLEGFGLSPVLYEGVDQVTDTRLELDYVNISGLNHFTSLKLLDIVGSYTLQNSVELSEVFVTAGGTVRIRPNLEGGLLVESETEEIVEQFELTTSITSIHISVAVLLALDQIQTYSLSLGQLNVSTVDCLLSAVHLLEISGINASVAHIAPPSLSDLVAPGVDMLLADALAEIFAMYEPSIMLALPFMISNAVDKSLNHILGVAIHKTTCPDYSFAGRGPRYLDFQESKYLQLAYDYVNFELGAEKLNEVIEGSGLSTITLDLDGKGYLLPTQYVFLGNIGTLLISLKAKFRQLDSIYHLNLLNATEPYVLDNHLGLGAPAPLLIDLTIYLAVRGGGLDGIVDHFTLTFTADRLMVMLDLLLKIDNVKLWDFQIGNLNIFECWLGVLDRFGFEQLLAVARSFALAVECHTCTSPTVQEWHERVQKPGATTELTEDMNWAFQWAINDKFSERSELAVEQYRIMVEQAPVICEAVHGRRWDGIKTTKDDISKAVAAAVAAGQLQPAHRHDEMCHGHGGAGCTVDHSDGHQISADVIGAAVGIVFSLCLCCAMRVAVRVKFRRESRRREKARREAAGLEPEAADAEAPDPGVSTKARAKKAAKPIATPTRNALASLAKTVNNEAAPEDGDDPDEGVLGRLRVPAAGAASVSRSASPVEKRDLPSRGTSPAGSRSASPSVSRGASLTKSGTESPASRPDVDDTAQGGAFSRLTVAVPRCNTFDSSASASRSLPRLGGEHSKLSAASSEIPAVINLVTTDPERALYKRSSTSCVAKVCVPLLLLTGIGLFIAGHCTLAASVDLTISVGGEEREAKGMFTFSLGASLKDMYHAGAWPLLILVGGLSGVWPYCKLLLIAHCFYRSPNRLPPGSRGRRLQVLDFFGKWSFIDLYVLALTVIAFHLIIEAPNKAYLPVGLISVELNVAPHAGMYTYVFGCVVAISVNHWVILIHRNAVVDDEATVEEAVEDGLGLQSPALLPPGKQLSNADKFSSEPDGGSTAMTPRGIHPTWMDAGTTDLTGPRRALARHREALRSHVFDFGVDQSGRRLRVGFGFMTQVVVFVLLVGGMYLTCLGVYEMSMYFVIHGIAGVLMDLGIPGSSEFEISFLSSAQLMNSFGLTYLAFTFIAVALLIPLAQMLTLTILWVFPLSLKTQKWLFFINESLSGWSGMEVFLVAAVVSLFEVGQVGLSLLDAP